MAHIRLLERQPDGEIVFRESTSYDVPDYAILSHTWGEEEVLFPDMESGADMSKTRSKAGWRKIQFCAKQAEADGLRYFWLDTCCIDRKNAVELGAAINSMFRWYQKAARCYVYLSDVSRHDNRANGERAWEETFRTSRWFTRGWTLQELIAPKLVDFFGSEGERLGSKLLLESQIHEITGIAKNALQGDALSIFSIKERKSWAERRNTTIEEDGVYCLMGVFEVTMVLNYGEGLDQAFRRLEEEIHRLYKGVDFGQFAIGLDLASFPEAAQFVARDEELSKMHEVLHGHNNRSAVILHGLGGIGKTQLALQYLRRHKEKYTAIFWLNANDEDSLMLGFRDIAQQVLKHHPSTRALTNVDLEGDLTRVVEAVKAWLDLFENTRWLMIYDNYDNPRTSSNSDPSTVEVRRYLPRSDHGSIIITTRSASVAHGQRLQIQKLTAPESGLQILSNMSRRKGVADDPDAIALVKKLDGLPLALSTAGAYLEHVTTSFAEYLQLYETSWIKLQIVSPRLSSYEDRSLYTTWQVTFDRIQNQNPASAQLLRLWAYFDKQDVWFELIRHAGSTDNEWIRKLTQDKLTFNEAVRLLCEYGLVHIEPSLRQSSESVGYSVHSCVHSWTRSVVNREWDDGLARLALSCVASEVPDTDVDKWWLLQQRLFQHAIRHEDFLTDTKTDTKDIEWVLHKIGDLYADQGKPAKAEVMYTRALQGYEEALGLKHTSTLLTVNNLGTLYRNQGKLAKAEALYIRALQGREDVLGPKHTSTLRTINNLGSLYKMQDKLSEAEVMYTRALQGYEETLGLKHISALHTVHNLGWLYADQGKLVEAEKMYTQALQGYKEALGPEHTLTLDTVNSLGWLYADQGKPAEAEKMYTQALQGREAALGPKHMSTLQTVNNLGNLYANQDKLAEAEAMLNRVLQSKEETLGSKHMWTLDTVNDLGILYKTQGKLTDAEAMYSRALQGYEGVLGPMHTSTLHTVNNLGNVYTSQGKLDDAEAMYTRALQGYGEALGPKHKWTFSTMNNLGALYRDQGKLDEAEAMYKSALQGREDTRGPKHTSTLNTVNNLANLYKKQGKLGQAEAMFNRVLEGRKEVLGPKHSSTLDTVYDLGLLYREQSKLSDAEAMLSRALRDKEEVLGPKHISTLDTVNDLGLVYADQGKLAKAEVMYSRALQGTEEALGPKHTSTLLTVNNLGKLYKKQGKLGKAEAMFSRVLVGREEALGPKHTSTLDTVNQLGNLYETLGRLRDAEAMLSRALRDKEEVLGPKHISTLDTVHDLGLVYADQGRLAEAEVMYVRALQGTKEALGPSHKSTLLTLNNLNLLHKKQGKTGSIWRIFRKMRPMDR